jgi:hypothetical protein
MNYKNLFILFIFLFGLRAVAQNPHILINSGDKATVLQKIKQEPWAKSVYAEMQKEVDEYVNRHQTDPQWILSRYL